MRSGNLLNCNRFQFISSEDFCQLPFLTVSGAQKKALSCRHPGRWLIPLPLSRSLAGQLPGWVKREPIIPDCHVRSLSKERLADGSSTRISPSGYAFGL
jgi:hypothetical protein